MFLEDNIHSVIFVFIKIIFNDFSMINPYRSTEISNAKDQLHRCLETLLNLKSWPE